MHGVQGLPFGDGGDQVAFKGNAVVLDDSVVVSEATHTHASPLVFSNGSVAHELSANRLYYCINVDQNGKGIFDSVEIEGGSSATVQASPLNR